MMTDWQFRDARDAAALDRYWDHLLGGPAAPPRNVSPQDAATIQAFDELSQQPPDPAFLARLEDQLMRTASPSFSSVTIPTGTFPAPGLLLGDILGSAASSARSHPRQRARSLTALAAVAILLIGLTVVSLKQQTIPPRPMHLSAITASPAAPASATGTETLLVLPLAGLLQPSVGPISSDRVTSSNLFMIEVEPHTTAAWGAKHAVIGSGPRIEYVLDGTYHVRAEAPMQIVRASNPGAVENVPAGTEVTLGPGDTRISRNAVAFTATTDDAPLHLLLGFLTIDKPYTEPIPLGWHIPDGVWDSIDFPDMTWSKSPSDLGAFQLRLQRVVLDPDADYALTAPAIGHMAIPDHAGAPFVRTGDGTIRNLGDDPLTSYVLTLEPQDP